jgi:DNA-binding PadR family transcriptional regulator
LINIGRGIARYPLYELIILSLLMRSPLHGYLILKIANDQIGPWAKVSSGSLYQILAKLEQARIIAVIQHESQHTTGERVDRQLRVFMITDEGRKRFRQVMMDTSSNLGDYQKLFRYKIGYIDLLQPRERLLLINHYVNYCQTYILHLETEMDALVHELANQPNPLYLKNVLNVMQHIERQWKGELDWARSLREEVIAQADHDSIVSPMDEKNLS